jgi:large subunit ribosomal protein L25
LAEQRLELRPRELLGRKVGRLRREGVVPAVIFGHGDSIPVQVDAKSFELGFRHWGRTTLITLTGIDGDIPALVHEVTRHPRNGSLVHVDFFRVSLTERTHAEVPLHFFGDSKAVKDLHGVLYHQKDSVNIEALPQDIPQRIDVDISRLETFDDAILVRDIAVDTSKIEVQDDPDELVIKVIPQRAEEVVAAPAAEAAVVEGEAAEGEAPAAPGAAGAAPAAGAKPGAPAAAGAKAPAAPAAGGKAPAEKQQPAKK